MNGRIETPSDEQWEAVRCTDEHLLIEAGAGSGKTFTVVAKLLYLMGVEMRGEQIANPLALRDIAAITYTNKAAAELKERLRTSLRDAGRRREAYRVDGARVGTIHAFCSDILREFALRSGRAPNLALIGDADARVLMSDVVHDTLLGALEDQSVGGLPKLLSAWRLSDIEKWVAELLSSSDALPNMSGTVGAAGPHERALVELALRAHATLIRELDESGQMDFDRMITWTRDLLRDDPTIRRILQRRIKVLIIDECQDIDPVQREIAYLLADPARRRIDTTRLVLVGDPKQSIYRFRKADVTVWRSVEEDFGGNRTGRVVQLTESRRSVAPLLAFVDDLVGSLLDVPLDITLGQQRFEVPYAPLTALRNESGGDGQGGSAIELMTIPPADDGRACGARVARPIEARGIAERALELHAGGFAWKDMAILVCGWGDVDIYMNALRRAGIPAYSLRADGFWECREVLDITVALAAILDPGDDRVLFGFLRSPFVGLTDESLIHIVRQTRSPCWHNLAHVQLPNADEHDRLVSGVELLQRLGSARDRITAARLIDELLMDTGYLMHLQILGDTSHGSAAQREANVRKLLRYANAHSDASVADILRTIGRERELGIREGDARLHAENDDVVTVTSVHSAKGLEWKCVFWADLVRQPRTEFNKLLVHGGNVILGTPDTKADEESAEWRSVRAAIDAEETAEMKRLWYVAATRAKDLLILSPIPLGTTGKLNMRAPVNALRT
ncbi:MAG: ATP-dependent helicase, partial [Gemmatimonadota bacterium]|nr:ATP-dependent helicase [Gemmatimonadota bacterium]